MRLLRYLWNWYKNTAKSAPGAYMWDDDPEARYRNTTRPNPPERDY